MNLTAVLFLILAVCAGPVTIPLPVHDAAALRYSTLDFPLPADLSRLKENRYPRLSRFSEPQIIAFCTRLQGEPIERRVAALAFLQVGTPYSGGALGEEQPPDTAPLLRYDVTDCAILNLVCAALAHVDASHSPRRCIVVANYAPGAAPTFNSRLHFTSDRIARSPYYRDVTAELGIKSLRTRPVTLNLRKNGSRWVDIDWQCPRTLTYVPANTVYPWHRLPETLGVAFVKESRLADGLDVVHEGVLYRGEKVVHASSKAGRVIVEPFTVMLKRYDGVIFFAYK